MQTDRSIPHILLLSVSTTTSEGLKGLMSTLTEVADSFMCDIYDHDGALTTQLVVSAKYKMKL